MTRPWVILAVAAQLLVLAWMAGEREWIFHTGKVIYLRTAPVDPRDLFRGDFVRLQYEINSLHGEGVDAPGGAAAQERKRHEVVYMSLREADGGLYESTGVSDIQPPGGVFLRGRVEDPWRMGWRGGGGHHVVKYGIEQLFVEQGSGLAIEKRRGTRGSLQVPMEMEIAVSSSGTAVIRGYRWSRLGMRLEVLRRPQQRIPNQPAPAGPLSPRLRLTLANTSDAPLAVADVGEHCNFHLLTVAWVKKTYEPASQACSGAQPAPRQITLAPNATYSVELDLSEPRWHVLADGKPAEIGALPNFPQFRIEYRAPDAAAGDPLLWRGRMASQAFNASGAID